MWYIIIALLWACSIFGICYYYHKTKDKTRKELYRELVRRKYKEIEATAQSQLATVTAQSNALREENEKLRRQFIQEKEEKQKELTKSLVEARAANERILAEQKQRITENEEIFRIQTEQEINCTLNDYLNEKANEIEVQFEQKKEELATVTAQLNEQFERDRAAVDDFHQKRLAINEAMRREQELKNQTDFHRICINEQEQSDINLISSWKGQLHNKAAINKLIWDIYIKNNLKDMQKRVLNGNSFGGIYKITRVDTGEAYIGRSSNILERWTNHLKTACGLEGAAPSAIHKAMAAHGIWNFTFEVLEKVDDTSKLGEREKFYIELYETDKQYNMSKGG